MKLKKDNDEIEYSNITAIIRISILILILIGIWYFVSGFIDPNNDDDELNKELDLNKDNISDNLDENKNSKLNDSNKELDKLKEEQDKINKFKDLSAEILIYNTNESRYLTLKNFVCEYCENFVIYISKDNKGIEKIKIGVIKEDDNKEFILPDTLKIDEYTFMIIEDPEDNSAAYFNLN